jgi:hypothetical protein
MGVVVFGFCKTCNDGEQKRLVSKNSGLCLHHYRFVKRQETIDKLKLKRSNVKVSDRQKEIDKEDEAFYRKIWRQRKHVSEVSDEPLGDKMSRWFMSHLLVKKLYPHYRHNPDNIVLMTKIEHFIWEFGMPTGERWDRIKEFQRKLREEYNEAEREGRWK